MVDSNEPGLSRTDVSGSEFDVAAPNSEKEAEQKKIWSKRAPKSPLMAVLRVGCSLFYIAGLVVISMAHFSTVSRLCRNNSGSFRKSRCIYRRGD